MPVVRIYCHGVHDFCPEGHDRYFLRAKYAFPDVHLTVGSMTNDTIEQNIGESQVKKLLYNELERLECSFHCRHVDEVLPQVPWNIDQDFLQKHKFDYITITDKQHEEFLAKNPFIEQLKTEGKYLQLKSDQVNLESAKGPLPLEQALQDKIAAFSDDKLAIEKRNKCDYNPNKRISYEQARSNSANRPVRVYADGIYDMFHPGHARQLKQAKEAFPNVQVHLMVGVVNDDLTNRYKGPVVVPEAWRYERVRHCRYVDEVVRDAPWVIDEAFLIKNKIDFVAHDDLPYKSEGHEDVYKHIKELGMFVTTQRMQGISTTDLKHRLKFN